MDASGAPGFRPRTLTLRGRVPVPAPVEKAFPLFSPEGETWWVPGWKPEYLDPPGPAWEEGQLFRTCEASGEAVWIVTRLDRERHRAGYRRVEPGHFVARVEVDCRQTGPGATEVEIVYSYVGLSESGNEAIAAMTEEEYAQKMHTWAGWVADYISGPRQGND